MEMAPQQSELIHRYLLGQLSDEDCERLELTYFEQTDVFLDLQEAKDRLIDRYLRGELTPEECRLFEQRFFSTDSLRGEVEVRRMARNFSGHNPGESPRREPLPAAWWRRGGESPGNRAPWACAVAALLLLAGIGIFRLVRGPAPDEPISGSRPPSSSLPATGAPSVIREIELAPTITVRSGDADNVRLHLDASVRQARLRLHLAGRLYPTYHSDLLKKDEGMRIVASNDALKPETAGSVPVVVWTLEANQLPDGEYQIEVQGIHEKGERAPAGAYDFTVRWR